MPLQGKNTVTELIIDDTLRELIDCATIVYKKNFTDDVRLGRCIFLSWYCALGNCDFCFRSTQKAKIQDPAKGRRTRESIYAEAFIAKVLHWNLEFITGGYGIFPFEDIVDIAKTMNAIFEEKIWINLGVLSRAQLEELAPYIAGVVASVETLEPKLHLKVAPGKPLAPYESLLVNAKSLGLKTSITLVLGLGESLADYHYVKEFIHRYTLDRITYYALRPVAGTPYKTGPAPEYVARWIAQTRIDFPSIEIVVGTAETRIPEIHLMLQAGANTFTKIPATKLFGTSGAAAIHNEVLTASRIFCSELQTLPPRLSWETIVTPVIADEKLRQRIIRKLHNYEKNTLRKPFKEFSVLTGTCESCGE